MQHLIDLIAARVIATIGVPPVYVDRGDIAASDWLVGDFTRDNAWHDLNLSGVIPSGLSLVHFRCFILSTVVNKAAMFRTKGNSNEINMHKFWVPVASMWHQMDFMIPPSVDNKVQYRISSTDITGMSLSIVGAFK